jgi:hypothetical protein
MLVAQLICSEPECAAVYEAAAGSLAELETLACDCGCGLRIRRVAEGPGSGQEPVVLEVLLLV